MWKETALAYLSGVLSLGSLVAATFFLKFWRTTRERLFAYFAAAFALLAIQRSFVLASDGWSEHAAWYYALRLIAFSLLIFGILENNRRNA